MRNTANRSHIPDSAFRLKWRKTWPDHPNDFVAREGKHRYCRIYLVNGGPQGGRWSWGACNDFKVSASGYADSAREAAYAAEQAYFRGKN